MKILLSVLILSVITTSNCLAQNISKRYVPPTYNPASSKLYGTIAKLDSTYFDAYNNSKPEVLDDLTAENLEFYHDHGGLSTSKAESNAAIKKNIFGKVTRTLTPGSLEVYEIPGFGAIEFGYHSFTNKIEQQTSQPSKFVIIWQQKANKWQVTRVISLH